MAEELTFKKVGGVWQMPPPAASASKVKVAQILANVLVFGATIFVYWLVFKVGGLLVQGLLALL